jgi:hypothetical protein
MSGSFIDTNIIIYNLSQDKIKQDIAIMLSHLATWLRLKYDFFYSMENHPLCCRRKCDGSTAH